MSGETRELAEIDYDEHRRKALTECQLYIKIRYRQKSRQKNGTMHFVFDFDEKVLLPNMERQPGNLHFTTGLKYDMFGISISNDQSSNVYGLPEGHWPGT